jgi:hypothetical protein
MKLWFRLTIVCGAWLCLLLGLRQPVSLNHPLHVVGTGSWFDRGNETTFDSLTASVFRSMAFDPVRAGPRESPALDCALSADHLGPPQDTHGPPESIGLGELPVKLAAQTNAIEQVSPRNYWLSTAELKNLGFATRFS